VVSVLQQLYARNGTIHVRRLFMCIPIVSYTTQIHLLLDIYYYLHNQIIHTMSSNLFQIEG
jgi:hypothetical protein